MAVHIYSKDSFLHKVMIMIWYLHIFQHYLTHCRLNELPHIIYWKILIAILGMSGYVI